MREPWLRDPDVTLYHGDVLDVLGELEPESVDCVVTSPPYWGLRDYGTGSWEGGDASCDHLENVRFSDSTGLRDTAHPNFQSENEGKATPFRDRCGKCGATRIDQQLGLERTPEEYVERMVDVFRAVRRVLAPHGTVWLNLGDSYSGSGPSGASYQSETTKRRAQGDGTDGAFRISKTLEARGLTYAEKQPIPPPGLKAKDLVGIPWRVAFALQADGWYLRADVIWAKPNPMPESVTDRPTKAHEYVFLLSKQARYYFDADAVREPYQWDGRMITTVQGGDGSIQHRNGERWPGLAKGSTAARASLIDAGSDESEEIERRYAGRNIRSVWEIATQPYPDAHFATFPQELARRCIAAGTSERGRCPECGAPWVRDFETVDDRHWTERNEFSQKQLANRDAGNRQDGISHAAPVNRTPIGWRASCSSSCVNGAKFRTQNPCVVLDPFMGSGTVGFVARKLGRHAIGIDLNAEYLELAAKRLQQQSLFAETIA